MEVIPINEGGTTIAIEDTDREVVLSNLVPGNIYEIVFEDESGQKSSKVVATKSQSSGEIKTYFNYKIPEWSDSKLYPTGTSFGEVEKALKDLIRSAKTSIDYCAYNTNVSSIVGELIDAKARGVRVRAIVERENNNTAFSSSLPFPLLQDRNSNLMHNKFIIIDPNDADNATVVNGAMNFTRGQMSSDPNHLLMIQDQSLARAYEIEFEEMWGSKEESFDHSKSKFGNAKIDNTPHEFVIGNIKSELFFSPSDKTSEEIINVLQTADYQIDVGLLIFTYWDLKDALIDQLKNQIKIRGIVEDDDNSSAVINQLRSNGADIQYHNANGIYHHKMAIIDAEYNDSNPIFVSGSHNWTYTAETGNDENTMIFYDADLAEMFKRAFSSEWSQLSTETYDKIRENQFVSPNPVVSSINFSIPFNGDFRLIDAGGRTILQGGIDGDRIDVSHLNSGHYLLKMYNEENSFAFKIIKI